MCDGRLHFYDRLQILEEKDRSLEQRERLRAVEKPLLAWYASRSKALQGMDIGNYAAADPGRGSKAVFRAVYGGVSRNS